MWVDVEDSKEKTKTPFYSRWAVCSRSINTFKALQIKLGIPLFASLYIPPSLVQNLLPRYSRAASDRSVAEKQFPLFHLDRKANQRAVLISIYSVATGPVAAQRSISFYQWGMEFCITKHRKPLAHANSWLQRWWASGDLSPPGVPASLLPLPSISSTMQTCLSQLNLFSNFPQGESRLSLSAIYLSTSACSIHPLLSLSKPLWPLLRGRTCVFFPKWASQHVLTLEADGNKKTATIHISSKGIREE